MIGQIIFNLFLVAVASIALSEADTVSSSFQFPNSGLTLNFFDKTDGVEYNIVRDDQILQSFKLDSQFARSDFRRISDGVILVGAGGRQLQIQITKDTPNLSIYKVSRNVTKGDAPQDCVNLEIGRISWYGGSEQFSQYWPVEKSEFANYSYVTKSADNCAIAERYWLNSRGVFIYVDEDVPLFLNQNSEGHTDQLCFNARKASPYNTDDEFFNFEYQIGIAQNVREAHMAAVTNFLHKPSGVPDERMIRYPIWSTWARYKKDIDEKVVQEFSDEILQYQFENSQLEIDDDWEECYGSLTFRNSKFSNITATTEELKAKGFRVTLWIHPFINKDCQPWYDEAKQNGYLVLDQSGSPVTQWWDSETGQAGAIDFTKPEAAEWFSNRLRKLQTDAGIDSFKFDAGESSWIPKDPVLQGDTALSPDSFTSAYIRTVAKFGPMIEVRSAEATQDLPIFVRMIDKDSNWGWNNGLRTLVTTLLQMNLAGYPYVLPDMIGGNGYGQLPDKELFIRWLQANVFMPSLQFSYVPWDFDQETVNISLAMTQLHDKYTDLILRRANIATTLGEPINPPLWWVDPYDVVAHQIHDQFMLGNDVISAPILEQGQEERDIYLPVGKWQDGNTGIVYEGPRWLMNYKAPLSVLPYFIHITP